jgi:hypothetical protein
MKDSVYDDMKESEREVADFLRELEEESIIEYEYLA